jgi:hypothetical protein
MVLPLIVLGFYSLLALDVALVGWLGVRTFLGTDIILNPVTLTLGTISSGFSMLASPFIVLFEWLVNYIFLPIILIAFIILFFAFQFALIWVYIWIGKNIFKAVPMLNDIIDLHIFKEIKLTDNNKNSFENNNSNNSQSSN